MGITEQRCDGILPFPMSKQEIAESFSSLDFHDDSFVDLRVSPPKSRGDASQSLVEVRLLQYSKRELRVLRFSGCANLRVSLDFDILAHNLPSNTSGVDAHTNLNRMRHLMETQKVDWGVEYGPKVLSPLDKKLATADDLLSFRVQFLGGAIEVVARGFEVETIHNQ